MMPLVIPRYLAQSGIQDTDLRYEWDDWDLDKAYEPMDDALFQRMEKVSCRGNLAFTIACAEWIVFRFDMVSTDPVPWHHLEAAWAGQVDWRYAHYWEPPDPLWLGPIRGPLSLAIIFTIEASNYANRNDHPAVSSCNVSNLAMHVMRDRGPFLAWQEHVVERLEQDYPFSDDDPLGDVVPRGAFDIDAPFDASQTETLVNAFLRSLDPRSNNLLRSPQEMLQEGFQGTPYLFDLTADRDGRVI